MVTTAIQPAFIHPLSQHRSSPSPLPHHHHPPPPRHHRPDIHLVLISPKPSPFPLWRCGHFTYAQDRPPDLPSTFILHPPPPFSTTTTSNASNNTTRRLARSSAAQTESSPRAGLTWARSRRTRRAGTGTGTRTGTGTGTRTGTHLERCTAHGAYTRQHGRRRLRAGSLAPAARVCSS